MRANRGRSAGKDVSMTAGLTSGDVSGMIRIQEDNTKYVTEAIDHALAEALDEIGQKVVNDAQQICPVDTGRLRNSISYKLGGGGFSFPGMGASVGHEVTVGSDVEYAAYVELGTSRTPAQPFLGPAARKNAGNYRDVIKKHMGG